MMTVCDQLLCIPVRRSLCSNGGEFSCSLSLKKQHLC